MNRFRARPRHPVTGARVWLSGRTPRELAAYLHRVDSLRSDLRLGLLSPEQVSAALSRLQHGSCTLERAVRAYAERRDLAELTRRRARELLGTHFAPLASRELGELSAPVVAAWVEALRGSDLAESTVMLCWRRLRAIVRFAVERGWVVTTWGDWRPARRPSTHRERECCRTPGELDAMLTAAAAIDELEPARCRRVLQCKIACAAFLGLRQGELAGLRWEDIEIRPGLVVVKLRRQWKGAPLKNRAPGHVDEVSAPWAPLAFLLDGVLMRSGRGRTGPVFPTEIGGHYTSGEVLTRAQVRECVRRAGLPNVQAWSAHSMRDSFVTLEYARTGDLALTAARSRHRSLATLARYLRASTRQHVASVILPGPSPANTERRPPALPGPLTNP